MLYALIILWCEGSNSYHSYRSERLVINYHDWFLALPISFPLNIGIRLHHHAGSNVNDKRNVTQAIVSATISWFMVSWGHDLLYGSIYYNDMDSCYVHTCVIMLLYA